MSTTRNYRRSSRGNDFKYDFLLNFAVGGLLIIGTLLVYAGTRDWFKSSGLDPEYYLKRHTLNILIGHYLPMAQL